MTALTPSTASSSSSSLCVLCARADRPGTLIITINAYLKSKPYCLWLVVYRFYRTTDYGCQKNEMLRRTTSYDIASWELRETILLLRYTPFTRAGSSSQLVEPASSCKRGISLISWPTSSSCLSPQCLQCYSRPAQSHSSQAWRLRRVSRLFITRRSQANTPSITGIN